MGGFKTSCLHSLDPVCSYKPGSEWLTPPYGEAGIYLAGGGVGWRGEGVVCRIPKKKNQYEGK